ncbi:DNA-binding transcriptional ArsR family regulator [Methanocalculus alkaliphilus]|uniref:ArsR/SmtB family transcription factor n=1 Tax=Methanocalculus alkaliphilus TaxID=768730 RepID=UPI00209E09CE|nr:helix-turn-helix domain-containing protein [Methanocalculus alkaliphilus]MCP1715249.1 DNA-binding transcriptional ArsR family regulator [Methanocalculus alkaliphilus]
MTDEIVFLEPGDEQAQKVARAMASPTAGDLLRGLADAPKSTTALSEELHIPLTTAKYHLGNLLDAGVIEVVDTRWSAKGREVKLYALKNQVLIVAPQRKSAIGLVKKYAATLGVFVAGTALLSLYLPSLSKRELADDYLVLTVPETMPAATRMAGDAAALPPLMHEFVTAFFLGGCLVLVAMMLYEAINWRRERN